MTWAHQYRPNCPCCRKNVDFFVISDSAAGPMSRTGSEGNSENRTAIGDDRRNDSITVSVAAEGLRFREGSSHTEVAGAAAAGAGRLTNNNKDNKISSQLVFADSTSQLNNRTSTGSMHGKEPNHECPFTCLQKHAFSL
jgi:hypothetical protein